MTNYLRSTLLATTLAFAGVSGAAAQDGDINLPNTLAWSAFDVGSSGYNQAVAIGQALQNAYGISLRVIPAGNDVSRLAPVRNNRIPFAAAGNDVFFAAEGVSAFATPEWGPQPLRMLSSASADNCLALGTAGEAGIQSMDDIAGKRIAWVLGAPALQTNIRAFLAFAGLTVDDVTLVEMPGYGQAWQALIDGQVDATTGLTTGGIVEQAAASPRGLHWVDMPFDNEEGWERLKEVAPHLAQREGTVGATLSPMNPLHCMAAPYPVLVTYENQDDELVYNMTKAVDQQVQAFANAEPTAAGWIAERQLFTWVLPFDDDAIRYWSERGIWTDEMQAHNDQLVERQSVLAEAWEGLTDLSPEGFEERWMDARAAALTEAGMPVYFE
ncbi:TAXI family TRAP transporter solute-binding subunit [Pelagibacterium xiamenense]|uniref:TAXI family TRAP transporter solute-binding subunit n=1 Tax=Pelagibacterium xiamenense TaxID=2901140 RepID=UPI001E3CE8EE|nr:TAXI family TRAP transporter solute-binding subunit [Pelagibacterium xiamenense]MCD7060644.1 TAXI family TRAP transporter solute-binding subunit [Pelagibacterium xiamenense]